MKEDKKRENRKETAVSIQLERRILMVKSMPKLARIVAVFVGLIVIILSLVRYFPLTNEGLVLAAFLICWGLDALI